MQQQPKWLLRPGHDSSTLARSAIDVVHSRFLDAFCCPSFVGGSVVTDGDIGWRWETAVPSDFDALYDVCNHDHGCMSRTARTKKASPKNELGHL